MHYSCTIKILNSQFCYPKRSTKILNVKKYYQVLVVLTQQRNYEQKLI